MTKTAVAFSIIDRSNGLRLELAPKMVLRVLEISTLIRSIKEYYAYMDRVLLSYEKNGSSTLRLSILARTLLPKRQMFPYQNYNIRYK